MREDLILTELEALANDIKIVVSRKLEERQEAEKRLKKWEDENKQNKKATPMPAFRAARPMQPELKYFQARLQSVMNYLMDGHLGSSVGNLIG